MGPLRMIDRGILPDGTKITEMIPMTPGTFSEGDSVRPCESLSADEKKLFSHMAEVYAAFSEYTDPQVGRVIAYLQESGQLDNTIVVYAADNGASGEGGPNTNGHYPTGWAMAFSTPFRTFKRYSYQGRVADPLVISRPKGIAARGEVRGQYHHVTDIVPTILEACGVTMPDVVDASADAPSKKATQYYEMLGTRVIWHNDWKAVAEHGPMPSAIGNFDKDRWQLFHTEADRSEAYDLAEQQPGKLRELVSIWFEEAKKFNVLPLIDLSLSDFLADGYEISVPVPPSGQYSYYPGTSEAPERPAANTHGVSCKVLAEVETTAATHGVVFAHGSPRFSGHALYVKDG